MSTGEVPDWLWVRIPNKEGIRCLEGAGKAHPQGLGSPGLAEERAAEQPEQVPPRASVDSALGAGRRGERGLALQPKHINNKGVP